VYSVGSPLGTAILGLKVGDSTTYAAPSGKAISVEIIKVATYQP
jgi:transcription elongation factor GreA